MLIFPICVEEVKQQNLLLYRIVRVGQVKDSYLKDDFKSSYERSIPPRGPQLRAPIIYQGISMFNTEKRAAGVAKRFPNLGRYIASLQLTPTSRVNYAQTLNKGHYTVWGAPLNLTLCITDILPVEKYLKEAP